MEDTQSVSALPTGSTIAQGPKTARGSMLSIVDMGIDSALRDSEVTIGLRVPGSRWRRPRTKRDALGNCSRL